MNLTKPKSAVEIHKRTMNIQWKFKFLCVAILWIGVAVAVIALSLRAL